MSLLPIQREVLPGGLTVLLCEIHDAPVAEFQIWAQVGSADERDHERGLAHFHEHMLFKGTERRGVGEVAGEVEGAGGRINAYTSYDVTVYHATMPAEQLGVGIDVVSDAVLHSVFEPEEVAREIDVVLEEIRRSEDSPGNVLGNAVFAEAYRVHPYHDPILGSAESVAAIDRERLFDFYGRWYAPDNLVVVAVGDFDRDRVLEQVGRAFEGARPAGARRARTREPTQSRLRTAVLGRPFERASLQLAYPGVALSHADAPHIDLASFVLGNCESSRLVRRVKDHDALVDRIDAYSYTPLDPGVVGIDFETDGERALDAIEAAVREVERLRVEPVTAEELEMARANFLASEHFERESVSGMASKIGGFHVSGGGWDRSDAYLETVRRATPEDLQRVAHTYLDPLRLTMGAVAPEADAARLEPADVQAAVDRAVTHTKRVFAGARARPSSEPDLASYELACGATLHVLPRRTAPVVAVRGAFLGGLLAEDASTSGITAFLTSMWLRGTESHSAAGFAAAVEKRAAEIDTFAGRNSFGATLDVTSAQLEASLDLFTEVLIEPALDLGEIERERRETLAAIERREDRLAQRAFLLFTQNLFRHHPYRMPTLGSAEVIGALDRDAILEHQRRLVRADNLVLAVAGDVEPDAVARQLSDRLADLSSEPFDPPTPPIEEPPHEIRRAELRKDRAQAHLVVGFRGLSLDDEDRFPLEVVSQLLAGQGGRLFLELRDRQGLAYSVSAVNVEGISPGYFAVYIATAPEKLEAARKGLLDELRRICESAPSGADLGRARRYLAGNFAIDQQRNSVRAAQASLDALYGLGPLASRSYPEQIAAVGADDVLRVAQRLFDLDAYTEAVVRP